MMDDFDDDYDPRAGLAEGDDEPLDPDDSFDVEQTTGQFDDSDLDGEDLEEEAEGQFEEDADEEMHDRGTTIPAQRCTARLSNPNSNVLLQKNHLPLYRPTYVRSLRSHPGPSPPPNRAAASQPSAIHPHHNTGNPTAPSPTR